MIISFSTTGKVQCNSIQYKAMKYPIIVLNFMLVVHVTAVLEFKSRNSTDHENGRAIETHGDIMLGGLFPVHSGFSSQPSKGCYRLNHALGIHLLEAMMYAVDMINNDPSILANYTVGVNLRDTCGQEVNGLEESLHFIKYNEGHIGKCEKSNTRSAIFGVIGAGYSRISMQVANLLRLFHIPQISYLSNYPVLSDRKKYEYFFRTVPPYTNQAQAMIDVIKYFNWSSVIGIYSQKDYWIRGMEVFAELTKSSGICMAASFKVGKDTDFSGIIEKMNEFENTRVVVLFLVGRDMDKLLTAVKRKTFSGGSITSKSKYRFKWLKSNLFGSKVDFIPEKHLEDVKNGAITFSLQSVTVLGFEAYFKNLTPENNKRNPWFRRFWEEYHNCSLSNNSISNMSLCTGNETLLQINGFDNHVPYVIDAAYAFAYAINTLIIRNCKVRECELSKLNGKPLLDILRGNFSFIGELGLIKFDKGGSTIRGYDIHEYSAYPKVGYKKIGSWLHKLKDMKATNKITSTCSETCKTGQIKVLKNSGTMCCFSCIDCGPNQFVEDETTCRFCNKYEIPNDSKTGCQQLPEVSIPASLALILMILSACGILATVLVILIFVYHNETPVVKASGRELSYPLLVSLALCYSVPFLFLAEPTEFICSITAAFSGLPFAICYANLVIKTIRIERLFKSHNSTRLSNIALLKPSLQVLSFLVAFLVLVVLALLELFIEAPRYEIKVDEARKQRFKCCVKTLYSRIFLFGSTIPLIIACTILAFRTRKVPSCFNEAKYIAFVMYTVCAVKISVMSTYYILSDNLKAVALSVASVLVTTSILLGVFGPKIYIIIFSPRRNNKSRWNIAIRQYGSSSKPYSENAAGIQRKMTASTESMTQTDDCD